MSWSVKIKKKFTKHISSFPKNIRENLESLIADLKACGPVRGDWPNYSKLSDGSHHCHLGYSYVVVWKVIDKHIQIIEVTYVGSRENAPY
ncbi:MAG: cytotoxic translational repressor of toxin-antitoxin stability system [Oligoflexia bacterium]|nr:cytotoxic translational repressor of toxin-antitoxin stability system [Oligoflexia bacterium]